MLDCTVCLNLLKAYCLKEMAELSTNSFSYGHYSIINAIP